MAYRSTSHLPYPASGPLEAYRLVTLLPTGQIAHCDASAKPLGVIECPALEAGQRIGVRLLNTEGTVEIEVSGAVAMGDEVMATADGKIVLVSGAGSHVIGMALVGAPAGGVVELVPYGYGHTLS